MSDRGSRVDEQQHQFELTRTIVERNGEAFVGMTTALNEFREEINLQREILLRFLDRLDEREPPQG